MSVETRTAQLVAELRGPGPSSNRLSRSLADLLDGQCKPRKLLQATLRSPVACKMAEDWLHEDPEHSDVGRGLYRRITRSRVQACSTFKGLWLLWESTAISGCPDWKLAHIALKDTDTQDAGPGEWQTTLVAADADYDAGSSSASSNSASSRGYSSAETSVEEGNTMADSLELSRRLLELKFGARQATGLPRESLFSVPSEPVKEISGAYSHADYWDRYTTDTEYNTDTEYTDLIDHTEHIDHHIEHIEHTLQLAWSPDPTVSIEDYWGD